MKYELTSGKCRLCGRAFSKRQMTKHLKTCWEQHQLAPRRKATPRWFHLIVEGRYSPEYWLHLQANADSTFGEVDAVLRAVWLECCYHLSAFEFPAKRAQHRREVEALVEALARGLPPPRWAGEAMEEDERMEQSLGSTLQPGMVFYHKYDFGSTTTLTLRVAGEHTVPALAGELKVLARNEPPRVLCAICQKTATQLCQECASAGEGGGLCDACAAQHACEEEMLVPLVNSPRTGVCGYCGPSVEP